MDKILIFSYSSSIFLYYHNITRNLKKINNFIVNQIPVRIRHEGLKII